MIYGGGGKIDTPCLPAGIQRAQRSAAKSGWATGTRD